MISIIYTYYNQPRMLRRQYEHWAYYSEEIKSKIETIVVDDCSTERANDVPRLHYLPLLKIFQVLIDIQWNYDGARNIGAYEATGDWLLFTDMDHVIPESTLASLLSMSLSPTHFYTFQRQLYKNGERTTPHPNSFLMSKKLWELHGWYDEDFSWGLYGKDLRFVARFEMFKKELSLPLRVAVDEVPDAAVHGLSRDVNYPLEEAIAIWKKKHNRPISFLSRPYRHVLTASSPGCTPDL